MESLKASALAAGVSDDEWRQMLAYSAAVFQNCGNYQSFGDTKFVPELDPEAFKKIARASEHYAIQKDTIDTILSEIENVIYNEEEPFARIGFRDENNGTTSYYSSDITKEEAK
jgi:dipeptidyl-peptidase-3